MSGYISWVPGKYLITAHEVGHNVGAQHAEAVQNCANTLMNSQLSASTALSFCQYSFLEISTYVTLNGTCLASVKASASDYDGDGKTDVSIFRPGPGEWWYRRSGDGVAPAFQFGQSTDRITPGDFTGDGKTDIAFWRPATGFWFVLRSEDSAFFAFPFGSNGDIPAPADYDGDGKADAAVYRPGTREWFVLRSSDQQVTFTTFGAPQDKPAVADFDGDGKADRKSVV